MDFIKTSVVFCNVVVRTVGSFGDVCVPGWGWGMVGGDKALEGVSQKLYLFPSPPFLIPSVC